MGSWPLGVEPSAWWLERRLRCSAAYSSGDSEPMELVTLRSYRDPVSAHVARAILEENDIPSFVWDEHVINVQWLYSTALGGAKLRVAEGDVERAEAILNRHDEADLGEVPEGRLPPAEGDTCPSCAGAEVRGSRLFRSSLAVSLWTGVPVFLWRQRWICQACGYSWKAHPAAEPRPSNATLEAERAVQGHRDGYPGILAFLVVLAILGIAYVAGYGALPS